MGKICYNHRYMIDNWSARIGQKAIPNPLLENDLRTSTNPPLAVFPHLTARQFNTEVAQDTEK